MARRTGWRELFTQVQRQLPKDATPQQRGEATRRAAAIYRGRMRSNPDDSRLVKWLVGGVVGYVVLKQMGLIR